MSTNWGADGFGWSARVGLLTHDDDTVPESEFWAMAPDGVSVHAARVPFTDPQTYSAPPGPDDAVGRPARLPLQGIVFAFTIGSYLLGLSGEKALVTRLEAHSGGIPVLMPAAAAVLAFQSLSVDRIALIHAPFFSDDLDLKGAEYFRSTGFDVMHASHLAPAQKIPHPNLGSASTPAEIYDWVRKNVPSSAQGIFIAGNGFRSIGAIAAIEKDLGRPVLTANQVALWHALNLADVKPRLDGYGKIFGANLQASLPSLSAGLRA